MTSDLMKRIKKNSKSDMIAEISKTELLNEKTQTPTRIAALNIALSGKVDGGFTSGITTFAGKSKSFKTLFALEMALGFLELNPEAVLVFFDSEFGAPISYFDNFGEAKERILHVPVTTVEELRTEMTNQLAGLDRDDKVIFIVDSVGNLASIKETDDSMDGKNVVDMTRAKMLKSFFRIVTPKLVMKNIPTIIINHTYDTIEMFSKQVMTGGTGAIYASDTIIFVGKQQEKEGTELKGWNFILNIEKSRYVREREKIPVKVTYEKGIHIHSGIFDLAVELGIIENPTKGFYTYGESGKVRRSKLENDPEVMEAIIDDEKFRQLVESKYTL